MITIQLTVEEKDQSKRIDKLLVDNYPEHSRSLIQKWITDKYITVNGQVIKPSYKCELDDEISGSIQEERPLIITPENIPLDISYEDDHLLIVNKPKGMVVHPSENHQKGTLVHALRYHCKNLSTIGGTKRPGIVHRIDKDTSGLLMIAKNDETHEALVEQFLKREVKRIYEAIVTGVIEHDRGTVDAPIGRDPKHRIRMAVVDEGRKSITHFQVVKRYEKFTYVQCELETGRTHQIRVHMDYIGHPLVGDPKYSEKGFHKLDGQALFSKSLTFIHPVSGETMHFEIEAPDHFQRLLKQLEKYA